MIAQILPATCIIYFVLQFHNYILLFIAFSIATHLLYFMHSPNNSKSCLLQRKTLLSVSISSLYLAFMVTYQPSSFTYYLSYILSISRKIYLLLEKSDKIQAEIIPDLVNLQCKSQIFNIFYFILESPIKVFLGESKLAFTLLQLLLLISFAVSKNYFSSEMRNAFKQTHFFLDRSSKLLGLRAWYHKIHGIVVRFFKLGWQKTLYENLYDN